MMIKSFLFGILGAVVAGLVVGVFGMAFGLSEASIVAIASPTGVALGLLGFTLPLARPVRATVRARRRR